MFNWNSLDIDLKATADAAHSSSYQSKINYYHNIAMKLTVPKIATAARNNFFSLTNYLLVEINLHVQVSYLFSVHKILYSKNDQL